MKHRESQEAKRKPATRERPSHLLVATPITLDQGIVVGVCPRHAVFFKLVLGGRGRTLLRDFAVRTDASPWDMAGILYLEGVPHSWWAKKSRRTISRGWRHSRRLGMATGVGAGCRVCRSLATSARDKSCCTRRNRRLRSPWSCSQAGWTHSCCEHSRSRTWFETPMHGMYTSRWASSGHFERGG